MLKRRHFPLFSTNQYAIGFFLLMLLAVAVQTLFILRQMQTIETEAQVQNRQDAHRDIEMALAQVQDAMQKNASTLQKWDEARQLYYSPLFYNYWRESRALSAGVLSSSIKAVDLYDLKGKTLNQGGKTSQDMPASIPPQTRHYVINHAGTLYTYAFFPINNGETGNQQIGWAGIKLDVMEFIRQHKLLQEIDANELRFDLPPEQAMNWNSLQQYSRFSIPANRSFNALAELSQTSLFTIIAMLLIFLLLGYSLLHVLLVRPLFRLAEHIFHLQANQNALVQDDYAGPLRLRELETIRFAFNDYHQRVDSLNTNLEFKNRELWDLAHVDPLSKVYNRRAFETDWQAILEHEKNAFSIAVLLFDCDHFKPINDTYGHTVGDEVIRGIASSLQKVLRAEDRLYRLGGDEFCTLLYDMDIASATHVAERCLQEVKNHDFAQLGIQEPVRISIGLSFGLLTDHSDLEKLLKQADLAMYQAKRPGAHKVVAFNADMEELSTAILSNPEVNAVFEAIQYGNGMVMHYQPIVSLPSGESDYFEALCRIEINDTVLTPGRIFPIVEMRRLEVEFDQAVLRAIRQDLEQEKLPPGTGISINISGPGIINTEIVEQLKQLHSWLATYKIVLEITETALITQLGRASEHIAALRELGFMIALDDFGSGYSSLRYLSGMPVDIVKFDISLVHSLLLDKRQSLIVENLVHLIRQAEYQTVAEGIDSTELYERVKQLGFSHAQGFLLGKPEREPVVHLVTAE